MTVPRKNPNGTKKVCALCLEDTKEYVKAHIPRLGKSTFWVHPDCELALNYYVSPYDQEHLFLDDARELLKKRNKRNELRI